MKKYIPVLMLILFSMPFVSHAQTKKTDGPQMVFSEESHDFGSIKEGVIAEYTFRYTNTGNQPLVLMDVRPSCGCTTPNWSKEPLQPGKTGEIIVKYNSSGRPGKFNKSISITSNIPNQTKVLFISGVVEPNKDQNVDPNQSPVRIGE